MSPKPPKILVTIATYNEMENLPALIQEIFEYVPAADILIVDDNSPDGTGVWCDEQAASNWRIRCIHRAGKLGLGTAIVTALRYAVEHSYEFVINMDADFSHHPRYLPSLIGGMDSPGLAPVDCMIGSRYVTGGGVEGWPLKRLLMSRGINLYARLLLGLSPRDCSGGFRCYRVALLKKLSFDTVRSRGYSLQEEILWLIKRVGGTFGETPIVFVNRVKGTSKINRKEAVAALRIILQLGIRNLFGAA